MLLHEREKPRPEKSKQVNYKRQEWPSPLKSFFVPDSNLQGSEFPIHLTWNREKLVRINIRFPSASMHLKEIYNVSKRGLKIEDGNLTITEFEINGYMGLVFEASIDKKSSVIVPVKVEIETDNGISHVVERKMLLFRPHIVAQTTPRKTELVSRNDRLNLKEKISLKNQGEGTAIVRLDIAKESNLSVKTTNEIKEFIEKFCTTLESKSQSLKEDFPEYSQIADEFTSLIIDMTKGTFAFTKEYAQEIQRISDEITRTFEENEEFSRDFLDALLGAYLSAVNIITEIHSFFEYLKSLAGKKVILLNATSAIELKPGSNNIIGHLRIKDLAHNVYKPIDVNMGVNVSSNKPVMLPLYSLFEWLGE